MLNVLVTAIGGDIGQGVLKSLKISSYKNQIKIIGTDINARAAGLFMCNQGYIVPKVADSPQKYLKKIIGICQQKKIDIAFICNEDEQLFLAGQIEKLKKKIHTYFVVQPLPVISICGDKLKTHEFLTKNSIRYPNSCIGLKNIKVLVKQHGYPIVLKPRSGYGGFQKIRIINNQNELNFWCKQMPNALAQEYIDNGKDEEYTVGLFLDNDSKALGAIPMLRKLRFSMTWHAIIGDYPKITALAVKTAETIGAIGPCNVQLRTDKNNQPCVIEINSRISSTTAFRALVGFNEAQASIDYFLKNKTPKLKYKKAVAMKIWDELIVPIGGYQKLKQDGMINN